MKITTLLMSLVLLASCSQNEPVSKQVKVKCSLVKYACGDCSNRYKVLESSAPRLKGKELILDSDQKLALDSIRSCWTCYDYYFTGEAVKEGSEWIIRPASDSISLKKDCCFEEKPEKPGVIGTWVLSSDPNQINYPQITFNNDATAIFSSRGDTIYRFKFSVKGDQLYLKDLVGKEEHYRIKMPAKDKLVFTTLREHQTEQVYKREN